MLLFIRSQILPTIYSLLNFNTSHVTVYHCTNFSSFIVSIISIHPMLLFIDFRAPPTQISEHFNTSHVTVYQIFLFCFSQPFSHFNTSHVTVYLYKQFVSVLTYHISIHPMLLFICYRHFLNMYQLISIHPMLLFIVSSICLTVF